MALEPDFVYTTKEASEVTGIYTRKLTRLGKKHNVTIINNTYVFTGAFLIEHLNKYNIKKNKIYTTTETAEILQVSDRTVRTYCKMWNVPKVKRSYQITEENITAFKKYLNIQKKDDTRTQNFSNWITRYLYKR